MINQDGTDPRNYGSHQFRNWWQQQPNVLALEENLHIDWHCENVGCSIPSFDELF